MKIAVIAWGSLCWEPKKLKHDKVWRDDGPLLPVEFCRFSFLETEEETVTLVLTEEGSECKTLWSMMDFNCLREARANLAERESAIEENISFLERDSVPENKYEERIQSWLIDKNLDAVIWTGFKPNWDIIRDKPFSIEDFLDYIDSKKNNLSKIKEYITKTPSTIKTKARNAFEDYLKSYMG